MNLSIDQDCPNAKINKNAINILNRQEQLPEYVNATLTKGPKHPIQNKFDEKAAAAAVRELIEHHESLGISQDIINDINIASYRYIQDNKKQRVDRASTYTAKYLKREKLVSLPYD